MIDQCELLFQEENCAHILDFLCNVLQVMPHLRIIVSNHQIPSLNRSPLAHYFKPLIIQVRRLSKMDAARLFMRRSHRPLRLDEIYGTSHPAPISSGSSSPPTFTSTPPSSRQYMQGAQSSPRKALVRALSQHSIMDGLGGHPCRISAAAMRVTSSLESLDHLAAELRVANKLDNSTNHEVHGAAKEMSQISRGLRQRQHGVLKKGTTKLQAIARGHLVRRRLFDRR